MPGPIILFHPQLSQYFTDTFLDENVLTANEKAIIATAAPKRKRDFATGRYCAKKALETYGVTEMELLRGVDKEPLWPAGYVGSISHAESLCGAVIGGDDIFTALGLDIEKIGGVKVEMWDMICTAKEQTLLKTVFKDRQDVFATLIFSIKESFYKLQYPLTHQFLEFTDVELNWDGSDFTIVVLKSDYKAPMDLSRTQIVWTEYAGQIISLCYLLK